MSAEITAEQVVQAARSLPEGEFTRADLAGKLGVERPEVRTGFKAARQAGQIEKAGDSPDGTRRFRLPRVPS
jgi:DNA-binding transcriptional regulator LsrR (DeoR family)